MTEPSKITSRVQGYLDGYISAKELIECIDNAVSSDEVYNYRQDVQNVILEYQDLFSLYVDDKKKRSEHSSYYGPEELRVLTERLRKALADADLAGKDE